MVCGPVGATPNLRRLSSDGCRTGLRSVPPSLLVKPHDSIFFRNHLIRNEIKFPNFCILFIRKADNENHQSEKSRRGSISAPPSSITPLKCNSCMEVLSFQILTAIDGTQTNETKELLDRDVLIFFLARKGDTTNLSRVPQVPGSPRMGLCPWGGGASHLGTWDTPNLDACKAPGAPGAGVPTDGSSSVGWRCLAFGHLGYHESMTGRVPQVPWAPGIPRT
jgi:hypothetical protein